MVGQREKRERPILARDSRQRNSRASCKAEPGLQRRASPGFSLQPLQTLHHRAPQKGLSLSAGSPSLQALLSPSQASHLPTRPLLARDPLSNLLSAAHSPLTAHRLPVSTPAGSQMPPPASCSGWSPEIFKRAPRPSRHDATLAPLPPNGRRRAFPLAERREPPPNGPSSSFRYAPPSPVLGDAAPPRWILPRRTRK